MDSQYKGVIWAPEVKQWHGQIEHRGNTICLGHFDTEEEAAMAYNVKAIHLFGEFVKVNLIERA